MARNPRPSLKRFIVLSIAVLAATAVGAVATASDPDSGTLTLEQRQLTWSGTSSGGVVAYQRPEVECGLGATATCDEYTLDVDIDPAHWDTHAGGAEVLIAWDDPAIDFDLAVYDGNELVGSSANSDTTSERVFIAGPAREGDAPKRYRVLVAPFDAPEGATYGGGVRLESRTSVTRTGGEVPDERLSDVPCDANGMAGPFPCDDVDLASFLPISELGGSRPLPQLEDVDKYAGGVPNDSLNDIWGWTDPETKREYALVGKTDGTAFVDITDPQNPVYRGQLVSRQSVAELVPAETIFKIWRDLKVYKDHMYVGSEEPAHGLQVFDLTRLRGETPASGTWSSDAGYDGFGNSHNIVINEESGFLYAVGTNTCAGGPHIVDIRDPKAPKEAGCVEEDGYTHDAQCVNYDGPDQGFVGREICFNSNEDTVTIVDVTDKSNPQQLARLGYEGSAYTHQGWLSEDGSRFIVNDELDEQSSGVGTTTRIFDVTNLNAPALVGTYEASVDSIDHNLYTKGDTVYEANYRSGLRLLDGRNVGEGQLSEVGFFDVYPADDAAEFNGAWSTYPYFPSGTVVVSGIEQGLFVLTPRSAAGGADGELDEPASEPEPEPGEKTPPASKAAPQARENAAPQSAVAGGQPQGRNQSRAAAAPSCRGGSLRTVGVQPFGRRGGLELEFEQAAGGPVSIDVLQQAAGRRVSGGRLVARFANRADDVRWNGIATRRGAKVRNGYYLVRYTTGSGAATEVRTLALRRSKGRWSTLPAPQRRATCDNLSAFAVSPVFGGRSARALRVTLASRETARAAVVVLRGDRVVKRFAPRTIRAGQVMRLRVGAARLRRGTHRVRVTLTGGGETVTALLAAKRI